MAGLSGTFTSPGTSAVYTPSPTAASFNFQVSGGVAAALTLVQSLNGGPYAGIPVSVISAAPGDDPSLYSATVDLPYVAPGQIPPTYKAVCTGIKSGTVNWILSS